MNVDRLREAAEDEASECRVLGTEAVYSISTFGILCSFERDSVDDLIMKICAEAPVGGRSIWLTTERALNEARFRVELSEPPQHHYNVILGPRLVSEDIERLVDLFKPNKRRNPAWKR